MAVTPTPASTPLPPAPQRLVDAPEVYVPKADAWADALEPFRQEQQAIAGAAEANAAASEAGALRSETAADAVVSLTDVWSVTTATLNVALGAQSCVVAAGLAFVADWQIALISLTDDTVRLTAEVVDYDDVTGDLDFDVTAVWGSAASATGWVVVLKALEGVSPEFASSLAAAFAMGL